MARNRDEESDELDLEDFDDEEYEDYENDETEDEEDDLLDNPIYKEIYSRAKADAEAAVISAITSEDTDTPVYKGLQKVVSKKDQRIQQQEQELLQLREALSGVYSEVTKTGRSGANTSKEVEAMRSVIEDMLEDEDSKKVFRNRMQQATASNEVDEMKQQIAALTSALTNQGRGNSNQRQSDDEPDEVKQYKSDFQSNLEELAKEAGVDPKSKKLDYGDWNESFLERTIKLNKSIKALKASTDDETIDRASRKTAQPRTRTEGGSDRRNEMGKSLLEQGALELTKKMRKVAFS